jgi:hypothetical protein
VSNFREEFLVLEGRAGLHLLTLIPIAQVPYSPDGFPVMGIVAPLEGPPWLPVRARNLSLGQYLTIEQGVVNLVDTDHQSSGRGMFRAWFGKRPHLLLHDLGSTWTFHTESFQKSLGSSPLQSSLAIKNPL